MQVKGLEEVLGKLAAWPDKLQQVMDTLMNASLLALWEAVPGYPEPPEGSTYRRTGTLGRTIGVEHSGEPEIYQVVANGGYTEGHFGTRLEYAPYVIGERQAWMHRGRWWTILDVAAKATDKIRAIWQEGRQQMVNWFNGGE